MLKSLGEARFFCTAYNHSSKWMTIPVLYYYQKTFTAVSHHPRNTLNHEKPVV
jgi:hypothetical protein